MRSGEGSIMAQASISPHPTVSTSVPPTILIVEDEQIIAMDIAESLTSLGYAISGPCTTGEEALKKVETDHPNLVLLDIMLQGHKDGIATAHRIRDDFETPVIFLTSYSDEATLEQAKVAQPYGYVLKPFKGRELRTTIEIALYKHQMEKKLKAANKRLIKLAKAKSDFTAMISHELRTPLSAITEGINIVLDGIDGPVTPDQNDTLSIVQSNTNRLKRLIDNVLDFSRMEAKKMDWYFEKTNLNELVGEVHAFMMPVAHKKEITFTLTLPEEKIGAVCDSDKIKQVLLNLVDNAIKFNRPNGQVELRLAHEEQSIRLEVRDTGIGIRSKNQKRIFGIFEQVREPEMWYTGGSGMGLPLCRDIIKSHQGTIALQSEFGTGSTFVVRFPDNLPTGKQSL